MNDEGQLAKNGRSGSGWISGFCICLGIYLLPFVAVLLDEMVFKSRWFSSHLPDWFGKLFRAMYFPLIKIINLLVR